MMERRADGYRIVDDPEQIDVDRLHGVARR